MSLREYLRANLFDGNEDGLVTMKKSDLMDSVVEAVMGFVVGEDEASVRTMMGLVNEVYEAAVIQSTEHTES